LRAFEYDVQNKLNILDVGPTVISTAQRLANQHPLRAYDAVQLASAWLANENLIRAEQRPLTFVCADNHLVAVAQAEGLLTENPSQYLEVSLPSEGQG
jgi:predicted nucleic acid-binding protein